jgi:cytochrome c
MTGPSLSGLWNRKAGTLPSFERYSPALTSFGDHLGRNYTRCLDLRSTMTFPGIEDSRQRVDLLAFLKGATQPSHAPSRARRGDQMGGMMQMMGEGTVPNLKKLEPDKRAAKITPLPGYVPGDDRGRKNARILGPQPSLDDRRE